MVITQHTKIAATPSQEELPSEVEGDTNDPFTVYMRSIQSSGSATTTPPLYKLTLQSPY